MTIKISEIDDIDDILKCYWQILDCQDKIIEIDLSQAKFIRANFVCVLGLVIEQKRNVDCSINIIEPKLAKLKKLLTDIGFLANKNKQSNTEMINYKNVKIDEKNDFYLNFEKYFILKAKNQLSNVSDGLFNILMQKILELFSNAFRHSDSKIGIFCSGQSFKNNKRFSFVIVDGGVGIKTNVSKYLNQLKHPSLYKYSFKFKLLKAILAILEKKISGEQAMRWAIKSGNSTTGMGGLGLDLIREFIIKNKGNLDIISNDARYSISNGEENHLPLSREFNGTFIALSIKIDEDRFFKLKGERC